MKFDRLIKLVRREEVTLFIGAGFSLKAGMPSVSVLRDEILNELNSDQRKKHENDGLDELSEYFVEEVCNGSRNSLVRLLRKSFDISPTCLDDHKALANIPHFHYILTTNYDTLLEDSYNKSDVQVIRTDEDCALIENKKPVTIIKVHGDFTKADSIVITKQDYADLLSNKRNPEMWKFVESEMLTKHIAFIGYSLGDKNIIALLKNISDKVHKNQRDMFLIAPLGKKEDKQEKEDFLKRMHIQYCDAYADEFLKELEDELGVNIIEDYKKHRITAETFSRYCHHHDIDPSISPQEDKDNVINGFKSLSGEPIKGQVLFTVDQQTNEKLEEKDFEKNGIRLPDSPNPNVPYIPIRGKDNSKGKYLVNGITISNSINEALVGPEVKDFPLTFIIPSRNYIQIVHTKSYNVRKGKFVVEFDGESYKAKMEVTVTKGIDGLFNLLINVNFSPKKFYHDNNKALRMIDIPDALFSKEDIYIKELSKDKINAGNDYQEEIIHNFDTQKHYFENIRTIEILSGKPFKLYNECSERSYFISIALRAYLEHRTLRVPCPQGVEFSLKAKEGTDIMKNAKKGKRMSLVITEDEKKFSLNDRIFVVPYTHNILKDCTVSIINDENTSDNIDVRYSPTTYSQYLSDHPATYEFPKMHPLK